MRAKKICIVLFLCICTLFLGACSTDNDSVYDQVTDQLTLDKLEQMSNGVDGYISASQYLQWCQNAKLYMIPIIVGSELFGIAVVGLFRKEKNIQKWAIRVFVIGIPLIVLLVVYVACYLYGKLF